MAGTVRTGAPVKPLRLLLSVPNRNHDQREQVKAAATRAKQLGVEVCVVDGHAKSANRRKQYSAMRCPDAVLVEPLTATALVRLAEVWFGAGIGRVLLNRDAEYVVRLRNKPHVRCSP